MLKVPVHLDHINNHLLFSRNFVSDIHAKTGQILNRGSAQQIGGSVGGGYDNTVAVKVMLSLKVQFTLSAKIVQNRFSHVKVTFPFRK